MLRPTPKNYAKDLGFDRTPLRSTLPDPRSHLKSSLPKPVGGPKKLPGKVSGGSRNVFKNSKQPPSRVLQNQEKETMLKKLTPMQYRVTQEKLTERYVHACDGHNLLLS